MYKTGIQRRLVVMATAAFMLALSSSALAQDATVQQKTEFRKLLRERDQLHRQLQVVDRRANTAMKQGQEPVGLYAEQVNLEDRLDLVQLRLEMMATRYSLPITALPGEKNLEGHATTPVGLNQRIDYVFARGRTRALESMRSDCDFFLGSLDFSEFLALDE